jgi:V/A-type H+-transporting ATPase subunit D
MALLATRSQLALAEQGQRLLEEKRDALLHELYREVRIVFATHDELAAAAGQARLALDEARVRLGAETVAAAAVDAMREVQVDVESVTVMGVAVPSVRPISLVRPAAARGRALTASGPALELAALRFEEALTIAIRLATMEARVRRLAREIRRTSSRVNALRTRVVPRLAGEARAIALVLEQREREDRYRLKRVKSARSRSAASRAAATGRATSPAMAAPGS